jgi:hypothetical protein
MSAEAFSEAKRVFELLPSAATMERAVGILAGAGVDLPRIHAWAWSAANVYGISSYITIHDWRRMLLGAAKLKGI